MIYTCPKCGKKIDLSTEVLINSEYKVVCPQCLCQLHIVGDFAYIPNDELELDTSIKPSRTINCPNCGHETSTGSHFCSNCGASFDAPPLPPTENDGAEDVTVLPPPLPGNDPFYNEAIRFLGGCTSITPMMLRDRFHISDERAAELIRQLEAGGIIGPYNNGGPRQILIPHRGLYDYRPPQDTPQGGTPRMGQSRPRRMGCFTWFIILIFFIYLLKACGA